jgi:hypothetical protein
MFWANKPLLRRWFWLPFVAGAGLLLLWAWATGWPDAITATDINQHRANVVLPVPQASQLIEQRFVPRHQGLSEIELILARQAEATVDGNARIRLQLFDDTGQLIAERAFDSHSLQHNQTLALRFPPQPQSAGRPYRLVIGGNAQNEVSVWGYNLDAHEQGAVTAGSATTAADLRFVTRYQLLPAAAVAHLWSILRSEGAYLLLALAFILLPGSLLLLLRPAGAAQWDWATGWGVAFVLGLCVWPLLWFWLSLLGGRWHGGLLWGLFILGWAVVGWQNRKKLTINNYQLSIVNWLLLLLLVMALAVRLLAVRDLVFPPWVDSGRHALITAVMVDNGRAISDYTPYLPVDYFPYHFGFHTLSASLSLMTGWPLPRLLLYLGQLLNALAPLAVYAGAVHLTRQPRAGLLAAFLVAFPFFFPAYYATWGRLTQLTAMLILPLALAFTWQIVRGGRSRRGDWWLLGIVVAGLFLVHFRVFLLYLPFAALVWLISVGRHGRWLAAGAALSFLLVAPRFFQLLQTTRPLQAINRPIPGYNDFPFNYVTVGWERPFIGLAAVALVVVLLATLQRREWVALPLTLTLWVASLFLLLSGERLGLPGTGLLNLNSMYITLFLPLAWLLAITAIRVWRLLGRGHWLLPVGGYTVAGALLAAAILFGGRQQIAILNPQTILAQPEDLAALTWLRDHLPAGAHIAVNSWLWLGSTWSSSDGGIWIVPLTGRRSTTPPADYIYNPVLGAEVAAFNSAALAREDWSAAAAADWLRSQGVTHVFVGGRGGFFDPAALARNPAMVMVYGRDGAYIFALEP